MSKMDNGAATIGSRALLIVLLVLAVVLVAALIYPFFPAFFIAAVLAGALTPTTDRVTRWLGGRRALAAGILTVAVLLAVVLPLGTLATIAAKETVEAAAWLRSTVKAEGAEGVIARLPSWMHKAGEYVIDKLPSGEDIGQLAGTQSGRAVSAVTGAIKATGQVVLQAVMMLLALFFLLIDGHRLVDWLDDVVPLRRVRVRELLNEFRRVSVAVLLSSLATAGVQAIVADIGYAIAKVPNVLFFGMATFIIGLIPALGATSVALLVAGIVFATGRPWWALFLALWALLFVGLVDNLIKPLLIKQGMELHGALVFFSLIGGLAVFGPIGVIAGPLAITFFLAVVRMCQREFGAPIGDKAGSPPATS
jgi:predicted PurR-regulated permease PerM